jgi:hypothetical protein
MYASTTFLSVFFTRMATQLPESWYRPRQFLHNLKGFWQEEGAFPKYFISGRSIRVGLPEFIGAVLWK